ncbi:hypothetical protein J0895_18835 [Phormidium pseudopriestleyi FRX01]|uniref:Uncharacterized protein n=1 Tax=Phormidium pseudopriestleyi FRX01 TaxID=1759528 RepID=A0ABS3FVD4_9CYAN|nr:hypothetical protein [Phormidium pseudopriestleyi]MBO0351089.1 hypothetical protein [Phormidium pseudopriestleyi FRX01]
MVTPISGDRPKGKPPHNPNPTQQSQAAQVPSNMLKSMRIESTIPSTGWQ